MDLENDIKEIKAALARIELLLNEGGGKVAQKTTDGAKPIKEAAQDFSGAAGGVKMLISQGYFKQKRQFADVMSKLQAEGYLYRKQRFHDALTRLTKTGGPLVSIKEGTKKVYAERK